MERRVRSRLVLGHVSIALVLVLIAATAIVALRATVRQAERASEIDRRLAALAELRESTREIARSARRFVLTGDARQQQRVLAVEAELLVSRAKHRVAARFVRGRELESELDAYVAAVKRSMQPEGTAIARFEDALLRARAPLDEAFEAITSRQRTQLEASSAPHVLATGAQWAIVLAALLGVVLAIGSLLVVLKKLPVRPSIPRASPAALRRESCDIATLVDAAIALHRPVAHQRGARVEFAAQLGIRVPVDRDQIKYVLSSLLGTAIAGSASGGTVTIGARPTDGGARIEIEADGAAPTDEDEIAQCHRIVQAHGGVLGVLDQPGGRRYWFTLRAEPTALN